MNKFQTIWLIFLLFGFSGYIQAQETAAFYKTKKPVHLQDAVETIVSRSPFWIYTQNKPDIDTYFFTLREQFPQYNFDWFFWHNYILYSSGYISEACHNLAEPKVVPQLYKKTYDYLILEIVSKDINCELNWSAVNLPLSIDGLIDQLILEKYLLKLIATEQYAELNQILSQLAKPILANPKLKTLFTFIEAALDIGNNRTKKGYITLKKLLTDEAGNYYETEIFRFLEKSHIVSGTFLNLTDWLKRSETLIKKGYPLIAKDIYFSLQKEHKINLTAEIAEAYFKAKDYNQASKYYEKLLNEHKQPLKGLSLITRLAQCYARSNQFEKAIKLYSSPNKGSIKLGNMPYRLAFLYFDSGRYKEALHHLSQSSGGKKNNDANLWLRFWSHYFLKDYKNALKVLDESTLVKEKSAQKKLTYWRARTLEKLGQKSLAKEAYKKLLFQNQPDYYDYLASQRLEFGSLEKSILVNLAKFKKPTQNPVPQINQFASTQSNIYTYLSSRLVGLSGLSAPVIDTLPQIDKLYLSSSYNTLTAIGSVQLKTRPPTFSQNAYYWAHPLAYREWVYFYSGLNGLDPFLSLSIMKQESGFRPAVESPALALGLMQIIPQTSRDLAKEVNMKRFHHQDIAIPHNNIRLATHYLKQRFSEFGNNLSYIIASYNAGPMAVNRWRLTGDHMEADEFIEQIPYDETQNYVKKVLTNYWTYLLLYTK